MSQDADCKPPLWRELAEKASTEQNPNKLTALGKELCQELEKYEAERKNKIQTTPTGPA